MQETSRTADLPGALGERIAATRDSLGDNLERLTQSRERLAETRQSVLAGRSEREILHDVAYARLLARLDTMPIIEQAKGILMAQSRCSAEEAFTMLRAASQRSNMKVRDLAQQIVTRVSGVELQRAAQSAEDEPSAVG